MNTEEIRNKVIDANPDPADTIEYLDVPELRCPVACIRNSDGTTGGTVFVDCCSPKDVYTLRTDDMQLAAKENTNEGVESMRAALQALDDLIKLETKLRWASVEHAGLTYYVLDEDDTATVGIDTHGFTPEPIEEEETMASFIKQTLAGN
jgi:hypothetical protein